ncbi:MAG TPA: twin-arginine translocase TatA/TatE family subunit [Vicinamibacterales bacterium]|nr:twin-arginine translocase TatA/TatE family subunit [Vicinamibacterales bacterium]
MGSIGMGEMIVIFIIALIIFGPRKLPELGRALGKGINEFKKASNDLRSTIEEEIRADAQKTPSASASEASPSEAHRILPPTEPTGVADVSLPAATVEPGTGGQTARTEHGA